MRLLAPGVRTRLRPRLAHNRAATIAFICGEPPGPNDELAAGDAWGPTRRSWRQSPPNADARWWPPSPMAWLGLDPRTTQGRPMNLKPPTMLPTVLPSSAADFEPPAADGKRGPDGGVGGDASGEPAPKRARPGAVAASGAGLATCLPVLAAAPAAATTVRPGAAYASKPQPQPPTPAPAPAKPRWINATQEDAATTTPGDVPVAATAKAVCLGPTGAVMRGSTAGAGTGPVVGPHSVTTVDGIVI